MSKRNKGAIRASLSAVGTTALVIDTAMEVALLNIQIMLEEEMLEAEITRAELAVRRAELSSSPIANPTKGGN